MISLGREGTMWRRMSRSLKRLDSSTSTSRCFISWMQFRVRFIRILCYDIYNIIERGLHSNRQQTAQNDKSPPIKDQQLESDDCGRSESKLSLGGGRRGYNGLFWPFGFGGQGLVIGINQILMGKIGAAGDTPASGYPQQSKRQKFSTFQYSFQQGRSLQSTPLPSHPPAYILNQSNRFLVYSTLLPSKSGRQNANCPGVKLYPFAGAVRRQNFHLSSAWQGIPQYIYLIGMQFSQMNKYESLLVRHVRPTYEQPQLSFDCPPLQRESINEVLSDLEEINLARSYSLCRMEATPTPDSPKGKSHPSSEETLEFDHSRTFASDSKIRSEGRNKSLIYRRPAFQKDKDTPAPCRSIKVYYFNLPTYKLLPYDSTTTVLQLINEALTAYLRDPQFDPSKIADRHHQNFQMRLLLSDNSHKADMSVAAISYDRLVSDNMFDELVLVQRERMERGSYRAEPIEYIGSGKKNSLTVNLYNELGEELGMLSLNRNDSIEKILDYIDSNDLHNMRNYYLTESQQDDDPLPRDFEVSNLESNNIYIKTKKYIDQSEFEVKTSRPIRSLTLIKKEREHLINLPMGLNEASKYEEFQVIKVNSMGFEQQRILGIDQTKIYNYDKNVREEKKGTSFLSKIFGANETTGTKRPFRLIEDIISLKTTDRGLVVGFKEKAIRYIVREEEARDRICKKLAYLTNYIREERRNADRNKP